MDRVKSVTRETIRLANKDLHEPPVFRIARYMSGFITQALVNTRITPNAVTLYQFFILICSALAFTVGSHAATMIGSVLIFLSLVIDCVDGELARVTSRTSKIGTQLEQMVHWSSGAFLLIGATAGTARNQEGETVVWLTGMFALAGETIFHFMYNQLNLYARKDISYGFIHPITKYLYLCMPINLNVLIIAGLAGRIFYALIFWSILSNVSSLVVFTLYYRIERGLARQSSLAQPEAVEQATTPADPPISLEVRSAVHE